MSRIIRIDTLHSGDYHSCAGNGSGFRIVVWWLGCDRHCKGCHNEQYWNFDDSKYDEFSDKHITQIINETQKYEKIYSGLSILGGEPFSEKNIKDVSILCDEYKKKFPDKNIWIWTGNHYEWLRLQEGEYGEYVKKIFNLCDFLVDGEFILSKRNVGLKFRGSTNQRIIDLKTGKEI